MPPPPALVIGRSSSGIPRRRRGGRALRLVRRSLGEGGSLGGGGFALLITITLLAFLVLLLVSLASLTRVETQVANNGQQASQARQNALMALNIALGELQKYAGPDQRVTARADVNSALANTTTQSGRWLGVYGRAVEAADTATRDLYSDIPSKIQTDIDKNSDDNGNQAVLLNWLVSGNENTAFNPGSMVDANGQIQRNLAPASFDFAHTDAVALGGATALSTDVTVKAKPARLLVGPGSASAAADYVAAPLVAVSAVAPGAGSSPVTVGNYAWWVGDENAKALVNLPAATAASDKALAFVASRRAAIELVDGVNPVGSTPAFSTTQLIGSAYQPSNVNLPNIVAASQLPLLTPGSSAKLSTAARHRFHDLTGYSYSILSDTYAGGLKKDLSALLAPLSATGLTAPADTDYLFPPEPNSGSNSIYNETGLPTWAALRKFVRTTATSGGLPPALPEFVASGTRLVPTPTSSGIAPVMTYAALGFQLVAADGDVANAPVSLAMYPVVVLWNPYTTPITGRQYVVGFQKVGGGVIEIQRFHDTIPPSSHTWSDADFKGKMDLSVATSASDPFFRFVLDNSGGIPAGQSVVFTLQPTNNKKAYVPADATNKLSSAQYSPFTCVLKSTGVTIDSPGATYRVAVNGSPPSVTKTTTPVTTFRSGTGANFNGNDHHAVYLSSDTAPVPTSTMPYSGTSFTSREWYQFVVVYNSAPFGNASSPYASNVGYAVSRGATGLVQREGLIPVTPSGPTFRMITRALFMWGEDRASGLSSQGRERWLALRNPRAFMMTGMPYWSAKDNQEKQGSSGTTGGRPPLDGPATTWPDGLVPKSGTTQVSSGTSLDDGLANNSTLFEFRPDTEPLMSIGQLQHANLAWNIVYPAYPIGNSLLPGTADTVVTLTQSNGVASSPTRINTASYDLSWLLNRSLWDKYFVSTVPHTGTGRTVSTSADDEFTTIPDPLPYPRHQRYNADVNASVLRNADQASAHLLLSGGFNINSTSEQAWRAVLGGNNQLSHDPTGTNAGGTASGDSVVSRFTKPTTNSGASAWQGYRKLTPEQIAQLAKDIVTQIRKRGPFVSMSDFVNRRLKDTDPFPNGPDDARFKGVLQAALDTTTTGTSAVNNAATSPFNSPLVQGFFTPNPSYAIMGSTVKSAPVSSTSAFAPQFLTQADLLTTIGSGLSARSDTFTIRTYGESINPVDSTVITGRAWCEAVVQRLPDYVDSAADPQPQQSPTAQINKDMGRRFKILSFRWLSSNDI